MTVDSRAPCLVGTARRTWRPDGSPSPEPLEMWDRLARAAARDASAHHDVIGAVDHLGLVHCQSWAYDRPADRLAGRLGITDAHRVESILAGTSPQRLINEAAVRMLEGRASVALVVGGEALATRRRHDLAGERPPWSHPRPGPLPPPVALDEWYLPTEVAHGVLPAWLTVSLLEQARWAERGGGSRGELRRVIGHLLSVAAANPDAWFDRVPPLDQVTTAGADNRMVSTPYTKRMTAFPHVDMAAANLLVTKEIADAWRIPEERRVYLRGWGFARDAIHVAGRAELGSSPAMRRATSAALGAAGMGADDIEVFDLYSCFGSAVQFATDALGLAPDDRRPRSLTGGLPYHGGPSSNYMSHSISHVVSLLRDGGAETAMMTGVGMHMTKHVAAVWSRTPGPIRSWDDPTAQRWDHPDGVDDRTVVDRVHGAGAVVAASVVHDRAGAPGHVVAICALDEGTRCYATTTDDAVMSAVLEDRWPHRRVAIEPTDRGTHTMRFIGRRQAPAA